MRVEVKLFAMLRERAGADSIELELPEAATVADAVRALAAAPELADLGGRMPIRIALNREYASDDASVAPGDELAAIPPVSGGAPRHPHARVSSKALDPTAVTRMVSDPGAGAVVTFQGTTRDVDLLEYEAYAEMATERIGAILGECVARHGLLAAAAEHRVGEVPLGEPSVVVAVSAAHRPEAFAGAREAIDRIKAEAPIWKKEIGGGAETWVEGVLP